MIKKTILWRLLLCQLLLMLSASLNLFSAQTGPTDDFDGDGIVNQFDLDDDNDGVPDAVESPLCYYTTSEWNAGAKPSYGVAISSALTTTTGNFSQLIDGVNNVTAVTFSNAPAQPIQNVNVYLFTFVQPVKLDALYLKFNTATQFANTTKIQGSNTNNGTDWVDLSAAIAATAGTNTTVNGGVSVTTSIKYPVTLNAATAYKYIRITGVAASNIAAQNASEVYFDFNTASYVASRYPKVTCTNDTDGDGNLNHFDLDSDGDGCSDAFESGATSNMSTNYQFPNVDSNGDGLVTAVDSDGDGIVNYTSTYSFYATSVIFKACADTDGDGILDLADLDDDNDGVPDKIECPSLFSNMTAAGGFSTSAANIPNWYMGFASSALPIVTSFTPTAIPVSNNGVVYNYGVGGGNQVNSPLTGGLFDLYDGANAATGLQYVLQENDPQRPVVCKLPNTLVAGAAYNYTFDLGNRGTGSTNNYIVLLYNADTQTPEKILELGVLNTLPAATDSPSYKNITGSFIPATSGNYLLMFYPSISGGGNDDFAIDRVAVAGAAVPACDTDGDGIPDYLDLDSDNDGCPDLREAGVAPSTDVFTPSSVNNNFGGTYGIDPAKLAGSQLNPTAADANNDGLNDSVDANLDGVPNYTSTYSFYAQTAALNLCIDTDGDSIGDIVDIDDDNDGILDAVESPSCFFTANEWNTGAKPNYGVTISSALTTTLANFSELIDGIGGTTAVAFSGTPTQAILNSNVYLFNFIQPVRLDALYLKFNTTTQFGGTTKIQGSNTNNGTDWVDLSAAISQTPATNTTVNGGVSVTTSIKYPVTLNTATAYKYIRITGAAASNIVAANASEVYFDFNTSTYIASQYPKSTCTNDTDGDGINNHLDLDSDGDGCPDAREAGVSINSGASGSMSASGGSIYTGGIPSGTANAYVGNGTPSQYNANGFFNGIETSAESGVYNGTYTYQYAIGSNYSTCADTDGDGINDVVDIDDDNDGILDAVESPGCFYTVAEIAIPQSATTQVINTGTIANVYDNDIATTFAFTNASTKVGQTVFEITPLSPLKAASLDVRYSTTTGNALGTTANSVSVDGWNGTSWVTLQTYTPAAAVANVQSFVIPGGSQAVYTKYRLQGLLGTVTNAVITEVGLTPAADYVPSAYPKSTCSNDTDGDGIPNHRDLDSDGDGCPDAVEAGVSVNSGASGSMSASGGSIYTGGILSGTVNAYVGNGTPSQYGANGFFDGIETSGNGVYNSAYTYQYATNSSENYCTDTDGDGVPDLIDLDDDNDGIIDCDEGLQADGSRYNVTILDNTSTTRTAQYVASNGVAMANVSVTPGSTDSWAGGAVGLTNTSDMLNTSMNMSGSPGEVTMQIQQLVTGYVEYNFTNRNDDPVGSTDHNQFILDYDESLFTATLLTNGVVTGVNSGDVIHSGTVYNKTGDYYIRIASKSIISASTTYTFKHTYLNSGAINLESPGLALMATTCIDIDTDGDGIPNRLDLDSDNDGCPDLVEARVSANPGAAGSMSTSGGSIYTGGIASGTANAYLGNGTPSQYGANGFFNGIETSSESGVYNGIGGYTYNYAISTFINRCNDHDGDGVEDINDIDDDNDGVPDAIESPSCYYTANEWNTAAIPDYTVAISSGLTTTTSNFDQLVDTEDNITAVTFSASPAQAIQNRDVYLFNFVNPIRLSALYLEFNTATQFGGTTKIQGSNTNNGTDWVDLSAAISQTPATNITVNGGVSIPNSIKYPVTLNTATAYKYIRITGVAASNILAQNASEIYFDVNTAYYIPSLYPKQNCTNDTDGDGTINQWDLNSDNDSCSDALEAGATTTSSAVYQFPDIDSNNDGLVDAVDPDGDGVVNYTSTYNPYATSSAINACTDTDNDGVKDIVDIDDDNDGVLDAIESPVCFYTAAEAMVVTKLSTGLLSSTINSVAVTPGNDIPTMHDNTTTSVAASNHVVAANQLGSTTYNIYKIEYPTAVSLTQMVVTGATASWGTGSFAVLEGSKDDAIYEAVSVPVAISTGTTKTWPVTLNTSTLYKYYRIRVSTVGTTQPTFTNYEVTGTINSSVYGASSHPKLGVNCSVDFDGDLIPNHLDNDSDNDGCPDSAEAGVIDYITTNGGTYSSGTLNNPASTTSSQAIVGNNTPAAYGNNGFYSLLENNDTSGASYLGTYIYSNAVNASILNCTTSCYKPAITSGTVLDTRQGITSLKRAGSDNENWPMVRKGGWMALESKTKGFVPNRLTITQINSIPAANLIEGMMVYNITSDCLYINTDGTATGWKCFNTQTCP